LTIAVVFVTYTYSGQSTRIPETLDGGRGFRAARNRAIRGKEKRPPEGSQAAGNSL